MQPYSQEEFQEVAQGAQLQRSSTSPTHCRGLQRLINKVMPEPHQPSLRTGSPQLDTATRWSSYNTIAEIDAATGMCRIIRTEVSQSDGLMRQQWERSRWHGQVP